MLNIFIIPQLNCTKCSISPRECDPAVKLTTTAFKLCVWVKGGVSLMKLFRYFRFLDTKSCVHNLLFLFFVVVSVLHCALNPVQLSVYIDLSKGRVFEEGVYIMYLCV